MSGTSVKFASFFSRFSFVREVIKKLDSFAQRIISSRSSPKPALARIINATSGVLPSPIHKIITFPAIFAKVRNGIAIFIVSLFCGHILAVRISNIAFEVSISVSLAITIDKIPATSLKTASLDMRVKKFSLAKPRELANISVVKSPRFSFKFAAMIVALIFLVGRVSASVI